VGALHNTVLLDETEAFMCRAQTIMKAGGHPSDILGLVYAESFSASNAQGDNAIFIDEDQSANENCLYAIGLHEMGHVVCGHNKRKQTSDHKTTFAEVVEMEFEAWGWAIANARRPIFEDDEVVCLMLDALSTYTDKLAILEQHGKVYEEEIDVGIGPDGRTSIRFPKSS
jgi:hypothetical protein